MKEQSVDCTRVCAAITRRAGCFSPRDYFANAKDTLQREAIMLSNSQRTA
jgi:hypothetical protein